MPVAWPDKEDNELLALVRDGSHPAFAALVERHKDRYYRLAFHYLQTREAAEDVVQDAFLCLDWQKRKRPVALNKEMPLIDDRESADQVMVRREEQRMLEQAIAALPERQRTAINLCFGEDLSNQDAADAMGVHLKALQSLIMRAKTTLKERMKKML